MSDFTLSCPDCERELRHFCTANVTQPVAQTGAAQGATGANAEIAHGFEVQDLAVRADLGKTYNKGYDQDFLVFWGVYPLKRDKRKAAKAWRNAVRRLGANRAVAQATILAGAARYRNDPNRVDEFTKYAEGWLNGDGWEDEPLPARKRGAPGSNLVALADEMDRRTGGGQ
jgi:hypothetical protein